MLKNSALLILFLCFSISGYTAGFSIKTSTIMDQPRIEPLGFYKGYWYVMGFEMPGNLNKPPRYKIYRYPIGLGSGKVSKLYPSFGEKTYYLHTAFNHDKLSMYYARCERRTDEETMLETRPDRKQLPVLMRQDFDLNTLEPAGEAVQIFDEKDEYFAASGILLAESDDRTKMALLIKPYYKQQKYKLIITDAQKGEVFNKTIDFKDTRDYLAFIDIGISNSGQVYFTAKKRTDVITLEKSSNDKSQNTFYLFTANATDPRPTFHKIASPMSGQFTDEPLLKVMPGGDALLAFDYYGDEKREFYKGTFLHRYNALFEVVGKKDLTPNADYAAQATEYSKGKKGKEFTHLKTTQLILTASSNVVVLCEHRDSLALADKTQPKAAVHHYLLAHRLDENLAPKAQYFVPKKQMSNTVHYAFSAQYFTKGNDVYLFHNGDWEEDGEHSMNLFFTLLPGNGNPSVTQKIVNTSQDFFTSMQEVYASPTGQVMFSEIRLVDYGDVSREVKLLELSLK